MLGLGIVGIAKAFPIFFCFASYLAWSAATGTGELMGIHDDKTELSRNATTSLSDSDQEKLNKIVESIMQWQTNASYCEGNPNGLFAERFRLLEEKGRGSYGVVYRAFDVTASQPEEIALKLLFFKPDHETSGVILPSQQKLEIIRNWIAEVDQHSRLNDVKGCVPILNWSLPNSDSLDAILKHVRKQPIWLMMPIYPWSLAECVRQGGGKLPVSEARCIMRSIAGTLQEMHNFDTNVIHCDLKPANLLLDNDGNVFVADFGLSKHRHAQAPTGNAGTPAFMAPEQYAGEEVTQRTDIFAWGAVFYALVVGEPPFVKASPAELQDRISSEHPADSISNLPGIPAYLSNIVDKCLEKSPGDRYGSFRDVLLAFQDGEFDEHRPPLQDVVDVDVDTSGRPVVIDDLIFHRRFLDYVENSDAEEQLDQFCSDPRPFLWWGVVGVGGVGKSRVAHELVRRLHRKHWNAGFLRVENEQATSEWLETESRKWRPHAPTLIIIDYSTRFARSMLSCMLNMSDGKWQRSIGEGALVRVLLLDRPGAGIAPASVDMLSEARAYAQSRDAVREHLFSATSPESNTVKAFGVQAGQTEPIVRDEELMQLAGMPREQWREVLMQSMAKAGGSRRALPEDGERDWWERVDRLTASGRPLFLQILGISFARKEQLVDELIVGDEGVEELLDDMLAYERTHHWKNLFEDSDVQPSDEEFRAVERAVGFITLARGITWPEDQDALHHCAGGRREAVETVAARILKGRQIPKTNSFAFPPLQPDLLGERLLINLARRVIDQKQSMGSPPPADPIDTDYWIRRALAVNESGTIATLGLLAQDFPSRPETIQWIDSLLRNVTDRLPTDLTGVNNLESVANTLAKVSTVVRRLAESRDQLEKTTWKLFERFVSKNTLTVSCAVLVFFSDASFDDNAQRINRIHALRLMLLEWPRIECVTTDTLRILSEWGGLLLAWNAKRKQFDKMEDWSKWLGETTKRCPDHPRIILEFTRGAAHAMCWYGEERQFADLETWGETLTSTAQRFPDDPGILEALADAAANAMHDYGIASQYADVERWGTVLTNVATSVQFRDHEAIQLALARGAADVMWRYGKAGQFANLETWGAVLTNAATAAQFRDDAEIQLRLARGAANAMFWYGEERQFADLETWGETLTSTAQRFPDDPGILEVLADTAANAMLDYGRASQYADVEKWGTVLTSVATVAQVRDHEEIQLAFVQGARLAMWSYGEAGQFANLETWGAVLTSVATVAQFRDHEEAQLAFVRGARNAMFWYGGEGQFADLETWGETLTSTAQRFPDDPGVLEVLASAAANAMHAYGRASQYADVERWGTVLTNVATSVQFRDHEAIQLAFVQGARHAVSYYGRVGQFERLEEWGAVLTQVAERFAECAEIQLQLVKGAVDQCLLNSDLDGDGRRIWLAILDEALSKSQTHGDTFREFVDRCLESSEIEERRRNGLEVLALLTRSWPEFEVDGLAPPRTLTQLLADMLDEPGGGDTQDK